MDAESQALYISLAALAARISTLEVVVGKDAPTLQHLLQESQLRASNTPCEYGKRREPVASGLLQAAYRKIHEAQVFGLPSLRNATALAVVETLILAYEDSAAFTGKASRKARSLSAAAASHLRIMAEECTSQPEEPLAFYSVAWTAIFRDAMVSIITGRALDLSVNERCVSCALNP
jgi:hypothetical protein